jgi:hypothetical protein
MQMVFDLESGVYVERYGFENNLYLLFHKNYMINSLVCSVVLFLFFVVSRLIEGYGMR